MEISELKEICKRGEGQYAEFKKKANHPNQIIEEVVGFANADGGNIYVGVDDDGTVAGIKFAEDDAIFLSSSIDKTIFPTPTYEYRLIKVTKEKSVIHFKIKSGEQKPYGLKVGDTIKVFYRVDDLCIKASRELKNILRNKSNKVGQKITYSKIEDDILKLVNNHTRLSKPQIMKVVNYKSRQVSDCLVRLVSAGILKIIPSVGNDFYSYP